MRAIPGGGERGAIVSSALLLASLAVLAIAVLSDAPTQEVVLVAAVVTTLVVAYRVLLEWRALVAALVLVILFIPIKRYSLPADLPFELEPYRLLVAFIVLSWFGSLLVDPRVRLRSTGFEAPLVFIIASILASELANPARVSELGSYVSKELTFFASFFVIVFLIASVVRTPEDVRFTLQILVVGAAVVAITLLFERRFLYNVFDHLEGIVPLLRRDFSVSSLFEVEYRLRVIGSAQHPIAMGAALAILIPPAVYLAVTARNRRWWIAVVVLGMGTMATAARTALVMLLAAGLTLLALRWRELRRYWPALLPCLILTWVAAPGAIGTIRSSFFPPGGLIAEQSTVVEGNEALANNRLADLGPAMQEFLRQPLFGQGFGTRITGFGEPFINAAILDNQWLSLLLETGVVGVAAWLSLFGVVIRRLVRRARSDTSPDGWLAAALMASVIAFGIGMFTYDAFSFIQVTFLFFIILGLAGVLFSQANPVGEPRRAERDSPY